MESVCPECLETISGKLLKNNDQILLEKRCPSHGLFRVVVWQGEPSFDSWVRPKLPYSGGERCNDAHGCPHDCGLCRHHTQRTCTALVEVTSRCNLNCAVCFADSGGNLPDPSLDVLGRTFTRLMDSTGGCNLQLSGGEPTVRKDLPDIVNMARESGFTFIQLNSNGLRFAEKPELAVQLSDAGLSSVFLQFDGITDAVYATLRGGDLFALKCRAIDNLAAAGLGIVLVVTVVRGVNTDQLWKIVQFGLARQPQVRGVHFQPISYFGRFPAHFRPNHVTLPELMRTLAQKSGGLLRVGDFRPPGCEHALCSFSARYLVKENGDLQRFGSEAACDCSPLPAEEGALKAIGTMARQWKGVLPMHMDTNINENDDLSLFLQRARTHTFQISAMAFQDAWSLNLERLQGCCIHVAQEDGRRIPFCSFNLTSRSGWPLHRKSATGRNVNVSRTPVDRLVARRLHLQGNWDRSSLEQARMAVLRRTVRHALSGSSFYRESLAGLDPGSLQTVEDLGRLPLLTSADIIHHGHRLLCVSQSRVSRVITLQTSGSTGQPKRFMFTDRDLSATLDFFLQGMYSLIDNNDRVLVILPFEQPDSVGNLLIRALMDGGIHAFGLWPLPPEAKKLVQSMGLTCAVGLPQHLLDLAERIGPGWLRFMLLCSDYASAALRRRIENACGCETFLHYGSTESGLGGAVECQMHSGCHLRESEVLLEIVDPCSGLNLEDGQLGEVVITTLDRQAMPLIRYRTGDLARLNHDPCVCGGLTARLYDIRGRLSGCHLEDAMLYSQDLDDELFHIPGLLDYRATLDDKRPARLQLEYIASPSDHQISAEIDRHLRQIPVIKVGLGKGTLTLGKIQQITEFEATHTVKRTILDLRNEGEYNETRAKSSC